MVESMTQVILCPQVILRGRHQAVSAHLVHHRFLVQAEVSATQVRLHALRLEVLQVSSQAARLALAVLKADLLQQGSGQAALAKSQAGSVADVAAQAS